MRILLDEDLPRRIASLLVGHEVSTAQRSGWSGVKNGQLLALTIVDFDRQAKSRLQKIAPRQAYRAMEKQLNAYAVVAHDGVAVTVGRREKRIPR